MINPIFFAVIAVQRCFKTQTFDSFYDITRTSCFRVVHKSTTAGCQGNWCFKYARSLFYAWFNWMNTGRTCHTSYLKCEQKSGTTIRKSIIKFAMVTQHGDRGWNRTDTPNDIRPVVLQPAHERLYHTTRVYAPYFLRTAVWVLLHPKKIRTVEELWHTTYCFSSLSEKPRKSNHLQMSQQRQCILPSYF